jgi:large subunit ribosomal protein L4
MKCDVKDLSNKTVGSVSLSDGIFGLPERKDILNEIVRWQLAKRRSGNHKTKGISEIRGTTKKPWRQKGTGRARTGSLRSPIFRGGATIFGPVVRDHSFDLPKKVRTLGLKTALSTKVKEGKLIVIEGFDGKLQKTKDFANVVKAFEFKTALIIDGEKVDEGLSNSAKNIIGIDVLPVQGINVYDILRRDSLVMTKAAVEQLEKRFK